MWNCKIWLTFFDINLSCQSILLGYNMMDPDEYNEINMVIMYAKWFIYKCKMTVVIPNIWNFYKYILECIKIMINASVCVKFYLRPNNCFCKYCAWNVRLWRKTKKWNTFAMVNFYYEWKG